MTEERKQLYRDLLGWAMVDMRMHSANATTMISSWLGRRRSHREVAQFTYAMSNWLHNTALYSAIDFVGFKEELFWKDHQRFRSKFPADKWAGLTETVVEKLQNS